MQLGNGKWESTQFNSRLQPTQIALGTVQIGTDKLKLDFTYDTPNTADNNGNVISQTITVPTETRNSTTYAAFTATQIYTYDALNRLKSAEETIPSQTGWKQTFQYDRFGNRTFDEANTTATMSFPKNCGTAPSLTVCTADRKVSNPSVNTANNRLSSSDGYTFDLAGNTTVDAQGRSYVYDAENKQIEVKDSSNVTIGQYLYDGDGKRVKKLSAAEETIFVYDAAGKEIAEYSTVSNATPQTSYLTADNLGTPRINTDQRGAVISRHDYQPYGEEIATPERNAGLKYQDDAVRKQFTGYERDQETDLDYAQARYYSKNHGRFTTSDDFLNDSDINNPQSWDKYIYVRNNPVMLTDPTGQCTPTVGNPCIKAPVISGPNNVPKQPNRERVPNVKELGYKDAPTGGHVLMNVESEFAAGDNIADYKTLRTAILSGGEIRSESAENPGKDQIAIVGNSKFVTDSPGLSTEVTNPATGETSLSPKGTLKDKTFRAAFITGEYNKKTDKLGANVGYYFVELSYGKDGKIDQSKSRVVPITRDQFIEAAKSAGVSKDKLKNPEKLLN